MHMYFVNLHDFFIFFGNYVYDLIPFILVNSSIAFDSQRERERERERGYHEAASSSANRTPPTGARKAAATPAAAPHVIKSRLSLSFLKYLSHVHVKWYLWDPPCPSREAMQAPVCTMGPSLPKMNPAETPPMEPKICWKYSARSLIRTVNGRCLLL